SNMPQPSQDDRRALLTWLETSLDAASAARPNPGRTDTLRRLNRTEYQNAVRDLLALDVDAASLLPADDSRNGFDNVTVGYRPRTVLDRYISAAQRIRRLAIGSTESSLQSDVIRLPADLTQEDHLPGLPLGTRGGVSVSRTFVRDGEYEIQVWLSRDLGGNVSGLREARAHELVVLVDRQPVARFKIEKPAGGDDTLRDKDWKTRVTVRAGRHEIGVTFVKDGSSLAESARQPLHAHYNDRRNPFVAPAINQISLTGPYEAKGAENTPSHRRLFVCRPESVPGKEEACARTILTTLMRPAYRRPSTKPDVERPMIFYRKRACGAPWLFYRRGRARKVVAAAIGEGGTPFLLNPDLVSALEDDQKTIPPGGVYRIGDLELASRLSFFLWNSIPDDELLAAA